MRFYMLEIRVNDWAACVAWFRDMLGLTVTLMDETNQFALFEMDGGRIALKQRSERVPRPTDDLIVLELDDLDGTLASLAARGVPLVSPVTASLEGYRRAVVEGPEGRPICLFMWNPKKS